MFVKRSEATEKLGNWQKIFDFHFFQGMCKVRKEETKLG